MKEPLKCKSCDNNTFHVKDFHFRGKYKKGGHPLFQYYFVCTKCEATHEVGELRKQS